MQTRIFTFAINFPHNTSLTMMNRLKDRVSGVIEAAGGIVISHTNEPDPASLARCKFCREVVTFESVSDRFMHVVEGGNWEVACRLTATPDN